MSYVLRVRGATRKIIIAISEAVVDDHDDKDDNIRNILEIQSRRPNPESELSLSHT